MVQWAVELNDLKKTYRTGPIEVSALRGVSLKIAPGEFVAAAGPSGSGKTTLLNIIGGLDRADSGEVRVAGQDLQLLSSGELAGLRLRRIGFVFQTYNLMPVLTALENAEFTLLLQGIPAHRRREKVHKLFAEIGLAGLEDRRPAELSGGQQQRVAVARAMVTEPGAHPGRRADRQSGLCHRHRAARRDATSQSRHRHYFHFLHPRSSSHGAGSSHDKVARRPDSK